MDNSNTSANNKRIAKNTILLYIRMLFLMLVSLYTSRIVLKVLGVEDFGIYNVVGGLVSMFSILSGSLSASISRFITYELGLGNQDKLKRIFSSAVTIQLILSGIIIIVAETIGLWFLNTKMTIPDDRIVATNWVFQFSIVTFAINLISVPYNAAIIAHEKMSAFAYISILEASAKLAIAYLIGISPIDKLIFYAILMCVVAIIIRLTYSSYCKRKFTECEYKFIWDKGLIKQMFGFAGWNFIGATSAILRDQGGNILINIFCGPVVNAARGIAVQVNNAVQSFVTNFLTALNPQITKSFATGNHDYMITLVFKGAKFSFYLLLVLSFPIIINTKEILSLWLDTVPEHSTMFVRLILIFALSESLSHPLVTVMLATGKIRNYQIIVGGLQMLNLPISYILLYWGIFPEIIIIVAIIMSQCCLIARLILLRNMVNLPIKLYFKNVYFKIIFISLISTILPILKLYLDFNISNIGLSFLSLFIILVVIYYIGLNKDEKKFIYLRFIKVLNKIS